MRLKKQVIVIGDRLLISHEDQSNRTETGLYLPPNVKEKERVQYGVVVKTGPGYPIANPNADDEPWKEPKSEVKYIPLQAEEGDTVLYVKDQAIEILFEGKKYFIVPQSAVLMIIRNTVETDDV